MIHKAAIEEFRTIEHTTDLCVIGGGPSGMLAAVAAARHGTKVVLMQDRPMVGGNASSEIRMWIRGAARADLKLRETGIIEELALENMYRNPRMNFSVWDSIMYGLVKAEPNITLLLNCSCLDASMNDGTITSVTGWQLTTQTYHHVTASIFADCSSDSILAPLTGAEWRMGREGSDEFGEDIAPAVSDSKTMGMSCLIQAREMSRPVTYTPPSWAYHYTKEDFTNKIDFSSRKAWQTDNYWWIELGGLVDAIADAETMRDELIPTVYGVWDYIKNSGDLDAENWDIEWIGFLPGKRESRRYVGDHILTQSDVRAEGSFPDLVAYGGWTMDDHHPAGFLTTEPPTIWHPAPAPYGIPYRCLYSVNVPNLMFAGRNISATHTALSSTRVMATCGILGQAMGTAAAIAIREGILPRDVSQHMDELQQTLMADDCYLPWHEHQVSEPMREAVISGDPTKTSAETSLLLDGIHRPIGDTDHAYEAPLTTPLTLTWDHAVHARELRLILDSDLERTSTPDNADWNVKLYPTPCNIRLDMPDLTMPDTLLKDFDIYLDGKLFAEIRDNYRRLVSISLNQDFHTLTLQGRSTWGCGTLRIYEMDLK